ncbi:hypothetical protein AB0K00_27065 [Dactylosporangium sp. NPDC049525]|uniref:hypothetical protein n=1 Tax=Dactylosporangium sp. NPDC049525 TaxID=3154730 RepID=UPI0034156553
MEPSADEAAAALRKIDQQRWQTREKTAPSVWLACTVFTVILVGIGLIEDLAGPSSGGFVMSLLLAGPVFGLATRTRWGSALLGRRSLSRSWIIGAGPDGSARSRIVTSAIWLVVAVAVAAVVVWRFDETAMPVQSDDALPNTILNLGAAIVGSVLYIAYRRWLAAKAKHR